MFFINPVEYEPRKGFLNKIVCFIFKHISSNFFEIKNTYYDADVEQLLLNIKKILPAADIPNMDDSIIWNIEDDGMHFHNTKLVYSREGLSLIKVMLKHKILIEKLKLNTYYFC